MPPPPSPKDVDIYTPTGNAKDVLASIYGKVVGCKSCLNWVLENLPGVLFDDFCFEVNEDEELCKSVSDGLQLLDGKHKDELNTKPSLAGMEKMTLGHEMYVKHLALSQADVVKEFGKTPKAINLRPYKVPARPKAEIVYPIKMCE